jgi:hypothetical protein
MWTCSRCNETLEDRFESCWNCGTDRSGATDPKFVAEAPPARLTGSRRLPMDCARCGGSLDEMGTKHFHEGARWGIPGNLAELFVNREGFDVYVCSRCGHVEFFLAGYGDSGQ